MLFQIDLPFPTNFKLIRSSYRGSIGWALALPEGKSILIDPTEELREYCSRDEISEFSSAGCLRIPQNFKIGNLKVYYACYHQKPYLFVYETKGREILFTMGLDRYERIVTKLKPKFVLTREGMVLNQSEAYLLSVVK